MSKTPAKNETSQFVSKEIVSPNKDQPGVSKTVFSHISNLHSLLNDWIRLREKGTRLFKAVSALKLQECNDNYYPSQLKPLMENVVEIVDSFKNVIDEQQILQINFSVQTEPETKSSASVSIIGVNIINQQLRSLAKLQPDDTPVISTWSVKQISEHVENLSDSMEKVFRLKQVVTENVAHCRDEKLIEVYVSSWEFEPYLNYDSYAYLFAEVGLPGIT